MILARCSLVILFSLASAALAQPPRRNNWNQAPRNLADLREVEVTGLFEAFENGALKIKDASTPCYVVLQAPQSKVSVAGTAKADFLKPGQLVTFTADIDKKGQVAEPLKELRITVASDTTKPGLFNEDRDNKESTRFYVCATVKTFKDGKLAVSAGGKQVQATLADDAVIKYEGTDARVLKPGDRVAVAGREIQRFNGAGAQPMPQVVFGEKVEITLLEPLSAASLKKTPPAKTK